VSSGIQDVYRVGRDYSCSGVSAWDLGRYAIGKDLAKGAEYRHVSRRVRSVTGGEADDDGGSCLSGNGAKDVSEVLLTLKKPEMADKLDWHVVA
jgi:hypothetical protein